MKDTPWEQKLRAMIYEQEEQRKEKEQRKQKEMICQEATQQRENRNQELIILAQSFPGAKQREISEVCMEELK